MNKFQQKRKAKKIWACLSSYKSQESSVLTYRNSLETSIFNLGDTLYTHTNPHQAHIVFSFMKQVLCRIFNLGKNVLLVPMFSVKRNQGPCTFVLVNLVLKL